MQYKLYSEFGSIIYIFDFSWFSTKSLLIATGTECIIYDMKIAMTYVALLIHHEKCMCITYFISVTSIWKIPTPI